MARPVCGAHLPTNDAVTPAKLCRGNNSSGDHFTCHFGLIDVA
jgi:hypothetical protein